LADPVSEAGARQDPRSGDGALKHVVTNTKCGNASLH
jgi:hypothetical protein